MKGGGRIKTCHLLSTYSVPGTVHYFVIPHNHFSEETGAQEGCLQEHFPPGVHTSEKRSAFIHSADWGLKLQGLTKAAWETTLLPPELVPSARSGLRTALCLHPGPDLPPPH